MPVIIFFRRRTQKMLQRFPLVVLHKIMKCLHPVSIWRVLYLNNHFRTTVAFYCGGSAAQTCSVQINILYLNNPDGYYVVFGRCKLPLKRSASF